MKSDIINADIINYDADSEPEINVFYEIGIFIMERNLKLNFEEYTTMLTENIPSYKQDTEENQNIKNTKYTETVEDIYNMIERKVFESIGEFLMNQNLEYTLETINHNNCNKECQLQPMYKNYFYISSDNLESVKNDIELELSSDENKQITHEFLDLISVTNSDSDSDEIIFPELINK
jgi:hypothetical protein